MVVFGSSGSGRGHNLQHSLTEFRKLVSMKRRVNKYHSLSLPGLLHVASGSFEAFRLWTVTQPAFRISPRSRLTLHTHYGNGRGYAAFTLVQRRLIFFQRMSGIGLTPRNVAKSSVSAWLSLCSNDENCKIFGADLLVAGYCCGL